MMVQGDEWVKKGAVTSLWTGVPRTCREEVMGIIGGGELGLCLLSLTFYPLPFVQR